MPLSKSPAMAGCETTAIINSDVTSSNDLIFNGNVRWALCLVIGSPSKAVSGATENETEPDDWL